MLIPGLYREYGAASAELEVALRYAPGGTTLQSAFEKAKKWYDLTVALVPH